jgi:hypothetical protein
MLVETPQEMKVVEEYDIATAGGLIMPVTIDPKEGDSFEELGDRFIIRLVPKSSIYDSEKKHPAEDITIYKQHVISVNHRTREVPPLTPEQQFQWQKTSQELGALKVIH